MKTLSQKSALLLTLIAVCACAVPSIASASSWGPVGTGHTLQSTDLQFRDFTGLLGSVVTSCTQVALTALVRSATLVTLTTAKFGNCTSTDFGVGFLGQCTTTWTGTRLPWVATGLSTTNVQIRGILIDIQYQNKPGSTNCHIPGTTTTLTGTVSGGQWTGNGAGQHGVTFDDAPGLTSYFPTLGSPSAPLTGTFSDTTQSLTLT